MSSAFVLPFRREKENRSISVERSLRRSDPCTASSSSIEGRRQDLSYSSGRLNDIPVGKYSIFSFEIGVHRRIDGKYLPDAYRSRMDSGLLVSPRQNCVVTAFVANAEGPRLTGSLGERRMRIKRDLKGRSGKYVLCTWNRYIFLCSVYVYIFIHGNASLLIKFC